MDNSPQCPFRFSTEYPENVSEQRITFKDYVIKRQSEHKLNLPQVIQQKENPKYKKQLNSLLNSDVNEDHHISSTCQIQLNELLQIQGLQTGRDYTRKTKSTVVIPALNIPPSPSNNFFKFQPQHKMRQTGMLSTRNRSEQLVQFTRKKRQNINTFFIAPIQTQQEIIHQYCSTKILKYNDELQHKPIGSSARLDYEANILFTRITQDYALYQKYKGKHIKHLKDVYRSLLGVGYDKEIMMDPGRLRSIHSQLNIRKDQFLRFKHLFMNQYLEMQTPQELFEKGCHKIENYKPLVLNKPLDFEIYGLESGIQQITVLMYDKIFKDYTLSPYFEAIDKETQAMKFSRLFAQLIDHTDSPNYTLEVLRERHVKYKLTLVQFANFKFYMSMTLQRQGIGFKYIRGLLRKMDTYKYAILNKESLQETINAFGYKEFIDQLVKTCSSDTQLYDLFQKRGKQRFAAHCENMIHFFYRSNVKSITDEDIEHIHKCSQELITEKVFLKMRQHFLDAVYKITNDHLLLSDYEEDWEEIAPFILNKSKRSQIKSMGGQQCINAVASTLAFDIMQGPQLNKVFEDNDTNIEQNLRCKLNLLLYGVHFYKKTEIEVLHKRLKITEQVYYEFQQALKHTLSQFPRLSWVNGLVEDYKKHIVAD